jgi:hypothetical protein
VLMVMLQIKAVRVNEPAIARGVGLKMETLQRISCLQ